MIYLLEIILIALAVVVVGWIFFIFSFTRQLVATFLKGEAPFVPTKAGILPKIAEALDLAENSTLYDLGCGDARILVACHKTQPKANFVGFEKDFVPYFWAKLRLRMMGLSKNIRIYKKDFFKADFQEATHMFLYLGPSQMKKLAEILGREISNGKKVFSLQFNIPNREAREIVNLGKEKLYIY
ncbi:MAG: class I SAM-dependent methyltransferase [Patescibacteria group bacterium]|nr:class I SAM-dependent methyltransferase [Patescibacteria group bacterium]